MGFKWFVDGLIDGSLGFAGEESAGASFLRRDGTVWTTDKDGIIPGLLAAEITARTGRDPGETFAGLTRELGTPFYAQDRCAGDGGTEAPAEVAVAGAARDARSWRASRSARRCRRLPAIGAAFGGIKVVAR